MAQRADWRGKMVTITVLFEGGANPTSNPNAETSENTNRLRESFNKLLNQGLTNEKVKIAAIPAYSISNAVKLRQENSLLLIDLDATKDQKQQRINDNHLKDIEDSVFFMVQEMEAWILSQPGVIEDVFRTFKKNKNLLSEDDTIRNKHPENITKPSIILDILLQRYFVYQKGEKIKKLKYGKLKLAPTLIEKLEIKQLCKTFEDAELLIQKINSY